MAGLDQGLYEGRVVEVSPRMTWPLLLLIVVAVSLNAVAQLFLRKLMLGVGTPAEGMEGVWAYGWAIGTSPWFVLGMACYVVSLGLWLMVLARAEVSLAYPFLSIGYVLTAVVGYFMLGESVGAVRVAGLVLICAGIAVISRS